MAHLLGKLDTHKGVTCKDKDMKVFKATVYVYDVNGFEDSALDRLDYFLTDDKYITGAMYDVKETEIEWDENIPINTNKCSHDEYEKLFKGR